MSVGTLDLNISVLETEDCGCKTISILDTSFYPTTPESPTLNISVPGYENYLTFPFVVGQVNIFNSYSLRITTSLTDDCVSDIPDGIYDFTYSICPNDVLYTTISHLRTCQLEARLAKYWARVVTVCDTESKVFKELDKIEILLKGAKSNAIICNPEKAIELYKKANDLLKRLEGSSTGCHC